MSPATLPPPAVVDPGELARIFAGRHPDPHSVLGVHPVEGGLVVRGLHPDAVRADCLLEGDGEQPMTAIGGPGAFAVFLPGRTLPLGYRFRFHFAGGAAWEQEDPYRFLPSIGDIDVYLISEGTHRCLWRALGAHARQLDGVDGIGFTVWAPSAQGVSVVGDFCRWDERRLPMRRLGTSGVFELFVPGVWAGALYKYRIVGPGGEVRMKADPFAQAMELPPSTASRVAASSYQWGDGEWMSDRVGQDLRRSPLAVYEVHLGSWARVTEEGNRPLTYREIAPKLIDHVRRHGYSHIEFLPLAEHPFTGSWGYQVSAYFAPTARYGTPDDLRYLIDECHRAGIGVIMDWVPAHFPKDDFALRRFDGTALYEHDDPRRGEHPEWGTLIFNYARREVRNFLVANALYWLEEFHVDGLRVDAVASMLYLDYSRPEGQWVPNRYGGREDLDAVEFLKSLNATVAEEHPGCFTVAEESTSWPRVTGPVAEGGLGFTFKWNMGWMHDTLRYFATDPVHRRYHHELLTFSMMYEYSEHFIMPLSHDEVVHGKGTLLGRMPGDEWQQFANMRALLAYQYTRPGKPLLFMGSEFGMRREWNHDRSLDWHLAEGELNAGLGRFLADLGARYREQPELWRGDPDPAGFFWLDADDRDHSVYAYVRRDDARATVVLLNLTPVPRHDYRVGAPLPGRYRLSLSSDDTRYGGSGFGLVDAAHTEPEPWQGQAQSFRIGLPPLAALLLTHEPD
ncbi:MAG: 1,4-alpha-glucan branching protein GlgB [Gemmatimonadales bacterium]|nr:1,4-alpha-glucan branching protein GlgB [Gemmatimonadales bacterium]